MAGLIQAGVKQLPKNSKDRQDEVKCGMQWRGLRPLFRMKRRAKGPLLDGDLESEGLRQSRVA